MRLEEYIVMFSGFFWLVRASLGKTPAVIVVVALVLVTLLLWCANADAGSLRLG